MLPLLYTVFFTSVHNIILRGLTVLSDPKNHRNAPTPLLIERPLNRAEGDHRLILSFEKRY